MGAEGKGNVIQPRVLKGFRDYLPPEMRARQEMIRKITGVFERFGFGPLQTPAPFHPHGREEFRRPSTRDAVERSAARGEP